MKKFLKFLVGLVAIGGIIAGAIYFLRNVVMKDYLDDYDDDDFDNDIYDEDDDDREYVTINPSDEDDAAKESTTTDTDASDMEFEA